MHVRLIAVGKVRERYLADAMADFRTRLRPYHRLEEVEVRAADGGDPERAMRAEGEAILKLLDPSDAGLAARAQRHGVLQRGAGAADRAPAARGRRAADRDRRRHLRRVGGAAARADLRWSLSPLTLLHEWARALVLEQLYRAAKIARDEPYHH